MENKDIIQNDEIDLKELIKLLWNNRMFIMLFTFFVTLMSILYLFYFKPYIPIFKGTLLVQIGEYNNQLDSVNLIEKPYNLKYILEKDFNCIIEIPNRSYGLLEISVEDNAREKIENKINEIYNKIIEIEKEKINLYKDKEYFNTKKIGKIKIGDQLINKPKKRLMIIISFVTSFLLSIFLVFFINFLKDLKREM
ncbi:Wzz/FepE/Etk N-terminal domain-containing protein [Halarcobacter ebronensis]|uniref:Wzz/FepE/Etk N-terminal domain-containing protein n=1 Tax=Halarcobacter ebronensis TaxID=1462615 RepID=UPI0013E92063|nr:Wzz/FepE/Etk N-terminal domain-containing protein [Halarcobacter ebronensis]QKF81081.1 putative chain length determinant protein, Wzz family [Halarcobacter ebronensis]